MAGPAHPTPALMQWLGEYLLCVFRLLFTWPWPVQPGVGHLSTFSCMAKTEREWGAQGEHSQSEVCIFLGQAHSSLG